ncbi:MAG: YlbF family regulator [Acholeplasmatales bacterium]|nr:YlbF family regulator [Acholeplasmatales bacterium]
MNSFNKIKDYFLDLPEVKRIKELENYIDNNKDINESFNKIKDIQKQLVNSKEFNQMNQYSILLNEYEKEKDRLINLPFVEEYLELLEIVNNMLLNLTEEISNKLNKEING